MRTIGGLVPALNRHCILTRRADLVRLQFLQVQATFSGMNVSDAKKLRTLEDENNRLRRMLADAMFDNAELKDLATKNS